MSMRSCKNGNCCLSLCRPWEAPMICSVIGTSSSATLLHYYQQRAVFPEGATVASAPTGPPLEAPLFPGNLFMYLCLIFADMIYIFCVCLCLLVSRPDCQTLKCRQCLQLLLFKCASKLSTNGFKELCTKCVSGLCKKSINISHFLRYTFTISSQALLIQYAWLTDHQFAGLEHPCVFVNTVSQGWVSKQDPLCNAQSNCTKPKGYI